MRGKINLLKEKIIKVYEKIKGNKKAIIVGVVVIATVSIGAIGLKILSVPTLTLESPKTMSSTNRDEIVIPAVLSKLPNNSYPATSVSIKFDNNKLEFVGLTIGTMQVYNDYDETKDEDPRYKIPQWIYNADVANQEGEIRAMYLDTTAGKNAYVQDGFKKKTNDMPFKLVFKLKDSVIPNEKIEVAINEAVFATVTGDVDKSTLSTKDNYGKLNVKDATIKIKG